MKTANKEMFQYAKYKEAELSKVSKIRVDKDYIGYTSYFRLEVIQILIMQEFYILHLQEDYKEKCNCLFLKVKFFIEIDTTIRNFRF